MSASGASTVHWIAGLCSVVFDIDVGQKVQHVVPDGFLSAEERSDVGFHAFPDSMSLELQGRSAIRDSSFMMRIKRRGVRAVSPEHPQDAELALHSVSQRNVLQATEGEEPSFLYGFVFCRQRQDQSLRRGGEQISVVVLSEHPLSGVLRPLSQIAGPLFFSSGATALQQVHREVSTWPLPVSGPLLQLQAGYSSLCSRLPSFQTLPGPSNRHICEPTATLYRRPSRRALSGTGERLTNGHNAEQSSSAGLSTSTSLGAHRSSSDQGEGAFDAAADAAVAAVAASRSGGGALASVSLSSPLHPAGPGGTPPGAALPPRPQADGVAMLRLASGTTLQESFSILSSAPSVTSSDGDAALPPRISRRASSMVVESQAATGAFHEVDIFSPLQSQLSRLWHLWELTLCAKPLLVVAPSPGDASTTIAALISIIAPVPYSADFRPYYTIQDVAFSRLAAGEMPTPSQGSVPTMLGVTNLYFVRALPHWPSVLSVGRKEAPASSWTAPAAAAVAAASALLPAMASALHPGNAMKALRQRAAGAQALLAGHTEHLWSVYKPVCRPDQVLLLRLLQPKPGDVKSKAARIALVNSDAIRRHFHELTAAFLEPFSVYFEPGPGGTVPAWDLDNFLLGRRAATPPPLLLERMGSVANLVELYARFASSVNFQRWYQLRRAPVEHLQEKAELPCEDGASAVFARAMQHIDEVELIQMFFSVEQQLQDMAAEVLSAEAAPEAQATLARLQRELLVLFVSMPEDLQQICVSSPERCELLLSLGLNSDHHARLSQLVTALRSGQQV